MKYPNKIEIIRMKHSGWNAMVTDEYYDKRGAWATDTSPKKALERLLKGLTHKKT